MANTIHTFDSTKLILEYFVEMTGRFLLLRELAHGDSNEITGLCELVENVSLLSSYVIRLMSDFLRR